VFPKVFYTEDVRKVFLVREADRFNSVGSIPTRVTKKVFDAVSVAYTIVYLQGEKNERSRVKRVQDALNYAKNSQECIDAFEAIGAVAIAEQKSQLVVVTQSVVKNPNHDKVWSRGSKVATTFRVGLAGNPTALSYPGIYPNSRGHRFFVVTDAAFQEKGDYLDVTIVHSLLHTGGKDGKGISYFKKDWDDLLVTGFVPSDLHYLGEKYDNVIKACTKNGSKVKKAKSYGGK